MVKLIRLVSEDNGNFNAELDDGIPINSNASIALQNLTVDTIFEAINITAKNNVITSNQDTELFASKEAALLVKTYNVSNNKEFFVDLESTLNETLGVTLNDGTGLQVGDVFRAINVDYPGKPNRDVEEVTMEMRYTPLIMPFFDNMTGLVRADDGDDDNVIFKSTQETAGQNQINYATGNGDLMENRGNMRLATGIAAGAALKYYISPVMPSVFMSRGCGIWGCRVQNLVDNAGVDDTNGFGVGLSFTIPTGITDILSTTRDFEIRVKKVATTYKYITPSIAHTEQDTALVPYAVTSPDEASGGYNNDYLIFWKQGNKLILQIWNRDGAANGQIAWSTTYTLSRDDMAKPLYPYIYICGASTGVNATDNIVGQPFFTCDPFANGNDDFSVTGGEQTIKSTFLDKKNLLSANSQMSDIIPVLKDTLFSEATLTPFYYWRMSYLVWNHIGVLSNNIENGYYNYGPFQSIYPIDEGVQSQQLRIIINAVAQYILVNSDNYVVILDSNPLLSYDASQFSYDDDESQPTTTYNQMKGRRLNILATIPVNDESGIIEYNANELVYIDLDNKYPQKIKNLRLRVLNKNLEPIISSGKSVMTLLIKNND